MDSFWLLLVGAVAGCALFWAIGRRLSRKRTAKPRPSAIGPAADEIYGLAEPVYKYFQSTAHPSDLRKHPNFMAGVELFSGDRYSTDTLLNYYRGDNATLACMALEALARRGDSETTRKSILDSVGKVSPWVFYFALNTLQTISSASEPLVGPVVLGLDDSWDFDPNRFSLHFLTDFARNRSRSGEKITFAERLRQIEPSQIETVQAVLKRLEAEIAAPLRTELKEWESTGIDTEFLESFGRIWKAGAESDRALVLEHPSLLERVDSLEQAFSQERRASAVVVGEAGVGKTLLIRLLAERLQRKGWTVFEAGHSELIAGQVYFGQFEERMQKLLRKLEGRRVVWVVPDLHAFLLLGRHRHSSVGALDLLMPFVESGRICLLAEAHPKAFERLVQEKPRLPVLFEVCRLSPTTEAATQELAQRWAASHSVSESAPILQPAVLQEAWQLSQQYLGHRAAPGNLLGLLELTRRRLAGGTDDWPTIAIDDLVVTLSQATGLPASILDDRQGLDLGALKSLFEQRVLGQPEAVDCLVERVAMIKAGVCDPTRPFGVFLFAGPTGTGKTEMAKTLAEFLFGSSDRMLRLDMSEMQTVESLSRILGEPDGEAVSGSLVDQIRKEPFSVVLLDEIEKAHRNVWDLFLQVFDDGRLTDRRGVSADFRHSIVIMTSNLGTDASSGPAPGFTRALEAFSPETVRRAIERTFRKEFLNRIDRLVVFRPLSRELMRQILGRELSDVFRRRGLRHRDWAVTWSEDAIDFLLEKGFSVDLGARPLKRAVERYLLSPLALATVNRELPSGDQLLWIRSDGLRLVVDFVDPDAPVGIEEKTAEDAVSLEQKEAALSLESIMLRAFGDAAAVDFLQRRLAAVEDWLESDSWRQKKEIALSLTSLPDFWSSPSRFSILERAERLDRIDAALRTARSQSTRLERQDPHTSRGAARLAQQLFLLQSGAADLEEERPWDAFLLIEGVSESSDARRADSFAVELAAMYRGWAEKRGMRVADLEERSSPFRLLLSVSGIAAYRLLMSEDGIQIWEAPGSGKSYDRIQARVSVLPQGPDGPLPSTKELLAQKAAEAFASRRDPPIRVVRRYRREPSPLVRDGVLRWRTGRLDLVLAGNFDLMSARSNRWLPSARVPSRA